MRAGTKYKSRTKVQHCLHPSFLTLCCSAISFRVKTQHEIIRWHSDSLIAIHTVYHLACERARVCCGTSKSKDARKESGPVRRAGKGPFRRLASFTALLRSPIRLSQIHLYSCRSVMSHSINTCVDTLDPAHHSFEQSYGNTQSCT